MEKTLLNKLKDYLSKRKDIICAYMFGSSVNGMALKRDLDIAILINKVVVRKSDLFDLQITLQIELQHLLRRPDIDVVILNVAPLLLRHEILKSNQIIYQRDEEKRVDFEVSSELQFYDFQPYRSLFWEALVKRI